MARGSIPALGNGGLDLTADQYPARSGDPEATGDTAGPLLPPAEAQVGLVWWDLEATLWFIAGWLETTYPEPTPPAAISGQAIVDVMSRFFPLPLGPQR